MYYDAKKAGQLIRRLRASRGISQEVLSGLSGIARSHLAMIETGSKNANVETLWRITAALGMRLSIFISILEEESD